MNRIRIWFGKNEAAWYLSPGISVMAFVFLFSIARVIQLSFMRIAKTADEVDRFVGLSNYRLILTEKPFIEAIKHNALLVLIVPVILVFLSILISSILFDRIRGWKFYRSLIFLPYILAIPVVGIAFTYIFQLNGILNTVLRFLHLDFAALNWLGSPKIALYTIMIVIIWKEIGFGVILFLARLSSVNEEIFEAARLDGANWWQVLRYITIPQLGTIIEFYIVIEAIMMFSWVFNYVFVMTAWGGPGTSTYILEFYIWLNAFRFNNMGYATTAAVILLIFTSLLIFIWMRLRNRRESGYE
ncbi:MAG: sugar ABC transporter permease [Actinobacteria bacterium]|nr:sugar ABC transporter permease [Actinomycetota bacterium]